MRKQMSGTAAFTILFIFTLLVAFWMVNLVKLVNCDWDNSKSWKGEVIHAIGLAGPLSAITVWFDDK